MAKAPITSPTLLLRLRDPLDRAAWELFVDLYGPLVYGYGRKQGLQDADAADLTQAVFRRVTAAIQSFEYTGAFRGWLFTIVRNQLHDMHRQPGGVRLALGGDVPEQPAADESVMWEQTYQRQLFHWAAAQAKVQFRPATWQAFWRCAVDGEDPEETARALNLSVAAVYMAKSRVMARLREIIQQAEAEETCHDVCQRVS